jgi:hypothetical protein
MRLRDRSNLVMLKCQNIICRSICEYPPTSRHLGLDFMSSIHAPSRSSRSSCQLEIHSFIHLVLCYAPPPPPITQNNIGTRHLLLVFYLLPPVTRPETLPLTGNTCSFPLLTRFPGSSPSSASSSSTRQRLSCSDSDILQDNGQPGII